MMEPAHLRPACGVRLHPLQCEAVLFDQPGQRMYRLNSAAACIWRHLEQNADPALAAAGIADALGIGEATAAGYMREMAEQWRELGLLDDSRPKQRVEPSRGEATTVAVPPELFAESATTYRRHYALVGTIISVGFTDKHLDDLVHPTLRHLEVATSRTADLTMDVVGLPGRHEIHCGGRLLATSRTLRSVAPLVNAHLFHLALQRCPHVMALHSGAVASGQGCLLLPATSGNGKTTLTAGLVRAGWRYMADDLVLLQHDGLKAVGVPNALGLKVGAWKALESSCPELRALAIHDRYDGKRVRYMTPPGFSQPDAIEAVAVRWIVFPHYGPSALTEMRPLSTADGLCQLMAHCSGLPGSLDHEQVGHIVRWIVRVACFDLAYPDLNAAVSEINGHTADGSRSG